MAFIILFLAQMVTMPMLSTSKDPSDSFSRLQKGNHRFMEKWQKKGQIRVELSKNQSPFACILACSDSRVSPEIIFDKRKGDLFVIRDAGNVIGKTEGESIRFAVEVLKTPLVLVLGHQNCGAIEAVLNKNTQIIPEISQLIQKALPKDKEISFVEAVKANVRYSLSQLEKDPFYQKLINEGKLALVGAYYDIKDGKVDFFKTIGSLSHQPNDEVQDQR